MPLALQTQNEKPRKAIWLTWREILQLYAGQPAFARLAKSAAQLAALARPHVDMTQDIALTLLRSTHGYADFIACYEQAKTQVPVFDTAGRHSLLGAFFANCTPEEALLHLCRVKVTALESNFCMDAVPFNPCEAAWIISMLCRSTWDTFIFLRRAYPKWHLLQSPLARIALVDRTWKATFHHSLLCGSSFDLDSALPRDATYLNKVRSLHVINCDVRKEQIATLARLRFEHRRSDGDQSSLDLISAGMWAANRVHFARFEGGNLITQSFSVSDHTRGDPTTHLDIDVFRRECLAAGCASVADGMQTIFTGFPAERGGANEAYMNVVRDQVAGKILLVGAGVASIRKRGDGGGEHRLVEHLLKRPKWPNLLANLGDEWDAPLASAASCDTNSADGLRLLSAVKSQLKAVMGGQLPQHVDVQMRLELATNPNAELLSFVADADAEGMGCAMNLEFVLAQMSGALRNLPLMEMKLETTPYAVLMFTSPADAVQSKRVLEWKDTLSPSGRIVREEVRATGLLVLGELTAEKLGVPYDTKLRSEFRLLMYTRIFVIRKSGNVSPASLFAWQGGLGKNSTVRFRGGHSRRPMLAALTLVLLDRGHTVAECVVMRVEHITADSLSDTLLISISRHAQPD